MWVYSGILIKHCPAFPIIMQPSTADFIEDGAYIFTELSGQKLFVADENTLSQPVELRLAARAANLLRRNASASSLPVLVLDQSITSGVILDAPSVSIPPRQEIQERTRFVVQEILEPINFPPEPLLLPVILESEESRSDLPGQEGLLAEIISEDFINGDYSRSARRLEELLIIRVGDSVEFPARFYYAQSLYFNGDPEAAVLQLLIIRERNPGLVNPWIDQILEEMRK